MIKIFKTNGALQIAIILAATVGIWAGALVSPPEMTGDATCGPVYLLLLRSVGALPRLAVVTAMLLTVAEGYLLNRLLYNKGLVPLNSLMPMLLYVVCMGIGVDTGGLTPALVANLWLLLALNSMMPKENMVMEENSIFNATMWYSMAVVTWVPTLFAAIPMIAGLLSYKVYKGREWGVAILGFLAPLIIVSTVLFLMDRMDVAGTYAASATGMLDIVADMDALAVVETAVFALTAGVATLSSISGLYAGTIAQRKHGLVLTSFLIYSVATLFYTRLMPVDAQGFAIPIATTGSIWLLGRKRRLWVYDILIAVLFLMSLYSYL